jgi:ribosomal protein S6E (S10)
VLDVFERSWIIAMAGWESKERGWRKRNQVRGNGDKI